MTNIVLLLLYKQNTNGGSKIRIIVIIPARINLQKEREEARNEMRHNLRLISIYAGMDSKPWQRCVAVMTDLHLKTIKWACNQLVQANLPVPDMFPTTIAALENYLREDCDWHLLEKLARQIYDLNAELPVGCTSVEGEFYTLLGCILDMFVYLDQQWQSEHLQQRLSVWHNERGIRSYAALIIKGSVLSHIPYALARIFGQKPGFWEDKVVDEIVAPNLARHIGP